ncbi:hypothetical protein Ancab_034390 [Ancistrocladus abbreviatus]
MQISIPFCDPNNATKFRVSYLTNLNPNGVLNSIFNSIPIRQSAPLKQAGNVEEYRMGNILLQVFTDKYYILVRGKWMNTILLQLHQKRMHSCQKTKGVPNICSRCRQFL